MLKNNLIIFLKYPDPGKVKTRLGKVVGYEKAANIYSILTKYLLTQLSDSNSYKITVCYTPEDKSVEISNWLNFNYMEPQIGNNLGEILSHAFETSFTNGFDNTIVIGTDCIEITYNDIEQAFSYLSENYNSVIGPTIDGGYYLIGLSGRNYPLIFEDISWGTETVFIKTIEKINMINLNNKVLNYYNDIDEISDINSNVIKIINSYEPNLRILN